MRSFQVISPAIQGLAGLQGLGRLELATHGVTRLSKQRGQLHAAGVVGAAPTGGQGRSRNHSLPYQATFTPLRLRGRVPSTPWCAKRVFLPGAEHTVPEHRQPSALSRSRGHGGDTAALPWKL